MSQQRGISGTLSTAANHVLGSIDRATGLSETWDPVSLLVTELLEWVPKLKSPPREAI